MSIKETVKQCLRAKQNKQYRAEYARQLQPAAYSTGIASVEKEAMARWREQAEKLELPGVKVCRLDFFAPISRKDFGEETEDILLFVHSGGELEEQAVFLMRAWFALYPETWLLYGDEDIRKRDGKRISPWLKPDWSPDLFLSCFYLGGVAAVRRDRLKAILESKEQEIQQFEKQRNRNLTMYELCFWLAEAAGGFLPGIPNSRIGHIESILFHHEEGRDCIGKFLQMPEDGSFLRPVRPERLWEKLPEGAGEREPLVSVIIPSKDQPEILRRNIYSLLRTTEGVPYEIILVDNGSREENRIKTEKLKEELTDKNIPCHYIYSPMPFHFSQMCNLGAGKAGGRLLLFLNDDIEAAEPGWLEMMAQKAEQPYTGAVGMKLLYPDSDRIQHAGIVSLPMGPVHKLQFLNDREEHYYARNRKNCNVSAVTGACLMVRKDLFWECGGFCMELPVAFNDVDLCFTLLEKGYYNTVINNTWLYHYESLSRGEDETSEKLKRLSKELEILYGRHEQLRVRDPYYHSWLNRKTLDTGIRPVFENTEPVLCSIKRIRLKKEARLHPGVLIRIESAQKAHIKEEYPQNLLLQGYALMLGDDNACYERSLIFAPLSERNIKADGPGTLPRRENGNRECPSRETGREPAENELLLEKEEEVYAAALPRELRLDLEENMPEQKNVALSGFSVNIQGLPPGEYVAGALLKNKITGVIYINWSRRTLQEGQAEDGL